MNFKDSSLYLFWVALAVAFTWLIHELGHWMAGTLLGYEMKMTLNQAGLVEGGYTPAWHSLVVTAAGPVVTILQACIVFAIFRKTSNVALYPLLFVPFYMRLLAGAINFIHLNDEGKLSLALGVGTYTLPALVSLALLTLVIKASRRAAFRTKFQVGTTLSVMLFSSILILLDQYLKIRLL